MLENYCEFLNVEELMQLLIIGKNTAYSLLQSGELKAFRVGKVWKIPRKSIDEFAMSRMTG